MPIFQYGKCISKVAVGGEEILRVYRNGKIVFVQDESVATYGLVFTGTQRISTGVAINPNLRVVVDVIQNAVSVETPLFGGRTSTDAGQWCYMQRGTTNDVRTDYNTTQATITRANVPFGQRLIIDKTKNVTKINGTERANPAVASFTSTATLCLGSIFTGTTAFTTCFNGTMFSCQVYNNDVLVKDYVPVPLGSTKYSPTAASQNCMWDKVGKVYATNAGNGSFGIVAV